MYIARILPLLIDFIFGLIELFLGLRVLFELFGANSSAPFVAWIYDISKTLLYPFQGIFPSPVLRGGFVLDMSAIVAILIYTIIAYLVSELVKFVSFNSNRYYQKGNKNRED